MYDIYKDFILKFCLFHAHGVYIYLKIMNKVCKYCMQTHISYLKTPLGLDINREKKKFCIIKAYCITKKLELIKENEFDFLIQRSKNTQ